MSTTSSPNLSDRAHEAVFRLAQLIWLPILDRLGEALYQWALARSKR